MIYPKPGDCYIISYPKSGRTWLRSLIGKFLFVNAGVTPDKLDYIVNTEFWKNTGVSNIWFSHDPLHGRAHILGYPKEMKLSDKSEYKDTKVIFLCRDPRDILVSFYLQKTKREGKKDVTLKTLSTYIRSRKAGIDCIIKFWNEWSKHRDVPRDFMLLKYEDMIDDIEKEFRRLLAFFDIPILNPKAVEIAIKFSSFDSMFKREKNCEYTYDKTMLARNVRNLDTFKIRRGKVGGFVDYLSEEEIDFLNKKMEELDPYYGYTTSKIR